MKESNYDDKYNECATAYHLKFLPIQLSTEYFQSSESVKH